MIMCLLKVPLLLLLFNKMCLLKAIARNSLEVYEEVCNRSYLLSAQSYPISILVSGGKYPEEHLSCSHAVLPLFPKEKKHPSLDVV